MDAHIGVGSRSDGTLNAQAQLLGLVGGVGIRAGAAVAYHIDFDTGVGLELLLCIAGDLERKHGLLQASAVGTGVQRLVVTRIQGDDDGAARRRPGSLRPLHAGPLGHGLEAFADKLLTAGGVHRGLHLGRAVAIGHRTGNLKSVRARKAVAQVDRERVPVLKDDIEGGEGHEPPAQASGVHGKAHGTPLDHIGLADVLEALAPKMEGRLGHGGVAVEHKGGPSDIGGGIGGLPNIDKGKGRLVDHRMAVCRGGRLFLSLPVLGIGGLARFANVVAGGGFLDHRRDVLPDYAPLVRRFGRDLPTGLPIASALFAVHAVVRDSLLNDDGGLGGLRFVLRALQNALEHGRASRFFCHHHDGRHRPDVHRQR